MQPTSLFSFPASPVFLRRLVILLLSSTLVLFLAGSALAQIDAPRPIVADAFTAGAWEPNELPDVAVVLSGVEADDPILETRVIPELQQLPGVVAVVGEVAPSGRIALHLSLATGVSDSVLPQIQATVEDGLPDAQISLGGRAVADRDLLDRLNRGMIVAVVPVVVLLTVLVAAALGVRFGLAAGGTIGLSTLLGGLVGASVAGSFDGSLATTAVPAVLVAVLVSSVLSFRLLDWFKQPFEGDQAEAIRQSVRHLLPEAALLFGGLIATALILEVAGGSTPTSVVAVGGLFASLVTFGALPALLATMGTVPDEEEYKLFRLNGPDGRDVPLAVLAGFACFLLVLGLFAIRVPDSTLMDESALPQGVTSRRVSEQLVELGGDPSSALLAEIARPAVDSPLDERAIADWGIAVSELPTVGWVETATGRYAGGALVSAPVSSTNFTTDTTTMAIVTPIITPRSAGAVDLVATLEAISADIFSTEVVLSGSSVDAADTVNGATLRLWLLVGLLAIFGALAVLLLVNDLVLAGLALALRLIGTLALLGVYYLVAGDVGVVELQIAALVFSVGVGLFEIGFLRRIRNDVAASLDQAVVETDVVNSAFRREGRAAMLGLAVTALCGLGLLSNDLVVARQLGVAVAAGVVIELLIGTWLLRPAVLGERTVSVGLGGSLFDLKSLNGDRDGRRLQTAGQPVTQKPRVDEPRVDEPRVDESRPGTPVADKPVVPVLDLPAPTGAPLTNEAAPSTDAISLDELLSGTSSSDGSSSDGSPSDGSSSDGSSSDGSSSEGVSSERASSKGASSDSSATSESASARLLGAMRERTWSNESSAQPSNATPEAWLPKLLTLVRDSLFEGSSKSSSPTKRSQKHTSPALFEEPGQEVAIPSADNTPVIGRSASVPITPAKTSAEKRAEKNAEKNAEKSDAENHVENHVENGVAAKPAKSDRAIASTSKVEDRSKRSPAETADEDVSEPVAGPSDEMPPPPQGKMLAPPATRASYVTDTEFGAGATAPNEPPRVIARSDSNVAFEPRRSGRRFDSVSSDAKTGAHSTDELAPAPESDERISIDAPATLDEHPAGENRNVSIRVSDIGDPEWRRIVANLLRQEFEFQAYPLKAELETVFVDGTPLFGELIEHNKRLRSSGLQVRGEGPVLQKVTLVNSGSPVTVAITVDHPARQLLDQSGRLLGTRPAERRDGMLWLIQDPSGRYRIAEAVDLGTTSTPDPDPEASTAPREAKRGTPTQLLP